MALSMIKKTMPVEEGVMQRGPRPNKGMTASGNDTFSYHTKAYHYFPDIIFSNHGLLRCVAVTSDKETSRRSNE